MGHSPVVQIRLQAAIVPHGSPRKATFKKDRRLNIRLSSKDLEAIQKRALAEGLPYQTRRPG
jgi:predicted DNA binding CopG/RHH family protein